MAHLAKIGCLTEPLITDITGLSAISHPHKFRELRDHALRSFRAHQYARVNQFDIQASLEGLDEKFRVLDRDDLADALKPRLQELGEMNGKWTPEILALFLELSDRPVEKSRVEDLELLRPPSPPKELTWEDILRDDPLNESGVWEDVDFREGSSEEEDADGGDAFESVERSPWKELEQDDEMHDEGFSTEAYITVPNPDLVTEMESAQFWRDREPTHGATEQSDEGSSLKITELQAIRESLLMLHGLQTSLFLFDTTGRVSLSARKVSMGHAMPATMGHALKEMAAIGSSLNRLREWARKRQTVSLLQTFHAVVVKRLRDFGWKLSDIEQRFISPTEATPVSLIRVHVDVGVLVRPLLTLNDLVLEVSSAGHGNPFVALELLYDRTSIAQMTGETETFISLATAFFECLQTYLKPIRRWMERGELGMDDPVFFVAMADQSTDASSLWHDLYVLRRDRNNKLHAPNFLHPAAKTIFNTGKSIVFLQRLGYDAGKDTLENIPEPRLDLESVCDTTSDIPLAPFSELFQAGFEGWIRSKYSLASSILRAQLFDRCGLGRALDALEYLYFSRDGSVFQLFSEALFEKMDQGVDRWKDRFFLTELAQSTFGAINCINGDNIVVRTVKSKYARRQLKAFSAIAVDYVLPWSLLNIIQRSSIAVYQKIFSLLLQVHRTKFLLQSVSFRTAPSPPDQNSKLSNLKYALRHRLIWFADIWHSFLSEAVLLATTAEMRQRMSEAEDIDAMAAVHSEHMRQLQSRCLLTKKLAPIYQAIVSILELCVQFADAQNALQKSRHEERSPPAQDARRKKNRRRSMVQTLLLQDDASSGDEEMEADYDADNEDFRSLRKSAPEEQLRKIRGEFEQQMAFVTAGLKGIGRAGGEGAWETLAERLEWENGRAKLLPS